jgi:hypothetical protein
MSVEHLPTYFGEVSYSIKKTGDTYYFSIFGDVKLPGNGIRIKNFNGSEWPSKVIINDAESKDFNNREIAVKTFPAEIEIHY